MNVRSDADLNQAIVTEILRREPKIDCQTAFVAGLEGIKDPQVLMIAAQEGRILISHDQNTMPSFAEFITNFATAIACSMFC